MALYYIDIPSIHCSVPSVSDEVIATLAWFAGTEQTKHYP